jgi:hypothetical protein
MKNLPLRSIGLALLIPLVVALPARAELIYYLPFDDGTNANLTNYGTIGGTATTSGTAPTAITNVPDNLGSTHAERTSASNTQIILPDSTTQARFTSAAGAQAMTFSTWLYYDKASPTYGWSDFFGNRAAGSGWLLSVVGGGTGGGLRLEYAGTTTTISRPTAAAIIPFQTWVNVTLTITSNGTTLDQAIYVNGALIKSTTGESLMVDTANNPISFRGGASSYQVAFDDAAMWDTTLTAGQIRAIYTAPAAISGLNVGKLNPLFAAHDTASVTPVVSGSISWSYATGFDVTSKALGDTWQSGANYYMWLGGDAMNPTGMLGVSMIPEPSTAAVLAGLAAFGLVAVRRKRAS